MWSTIRPGRTLFRVLVGVLILVLALVRFAEYLVHGDIAGAARIDMKGDLRNVAHAESLYFDVHRTFTSAVAELRFKPSRGVSLIIDRADSTAWHATATNRHVSEICDLGGTAGATAGVLHCR